MRGLRMVLSCVLLAGAAKAAEPVDVGARRQLFVEPGLIDRLEGARLEVRPLVPREIVFTFDAPHEGNVSAYVTVFCDGEAPSRESGERGGKGRPRSQPRSTEEPKPSRDLNFKKFRMYYRGANYDWKTRKTEHELACYAESTDGIHWTRPKLGLVAFNGSRDNNIVLQGQGAHNFTPFKDANPDCPPAEKYKAVGTGNGGLIAFGSPDGIHWAPIGEAPIITKGAFDSQNLAFWDAERGRYVDFHRGFRDGRRDILTATSSDFRHWTEPVYFDYGAAKAQHLYTNNAMVYFRAPHLYLAFPNRFLPSRPPAVNPTEEHDMPGVNDSLVMASRDGLNWHMWEEAFLRPGPNRERWWQRNNYLAWGMLVTPSDLPGAPDELSFYANENYYIGPCRLRRYTSRLDGFVAASAPYAGGELITQAFRFQGSELVLNFASSAAGSVRCELQDAAGKPIEGFTLADCPDAYGDEIERVVRWTAGSDVSSLAGQAVRLRVRLQDADLFAFQFRDPASRAPAK